MADFRFVKQEAQTANGGEYKSNIIIIIIIIVIIIIVVIL